MKNWGMSKLPPRVRQEGKREIQHEEEKEQKEKKKKSCKKSKASSIELNGRDSREAHQKRRGAIAKGEVHEKETVSY